MEAQVPTRKTDRDKSAGGGNDEITTRSGGTPAGFHDAITNVRVRPTTSRRRHPEKGVDAYIAKLSEEHKSAIQRVRDIIRSVAPTATEEIHMSVPTFMYHGPLVSFAVVRKHCSFFVRSPALMQAMQKELAPYVAGPGTLRFSHMEPLPTPLLRAIVKARMGENEGASPA